MKRQKNEKNTHASKTKSTKKRRPRVRPHRQRPRVWIGSNQLFTENFHIAEQIESSGHFGKVFQCHRKSDEKIFAVKAICKARFYRLDKSSFQRDALLCAMEGELDVMRAIKGQNPYIVDMEGLYQDKTMLYIVTQKCHGGNLFDRIMMKYKSGEHLSEHYVSKILKMIGDAIRFIHLFHCVSHCNLRAEKILFLSKNENSPIKIIDLGFAKVIPRLRSQSKLNDTPYYTAPEVIEEGRYGNGVDMWSVGVIMFIMLFGFPPFYNNPQKFYDTNEIKALYTLVCLTSYAYMANFSAKN